MENFYSFLSTNPHFNKIEYNHLTIIEYNCPLTQEYVPVWTPYDYIVHIISGKKTWHTHDGSVTLKEGDTAYIKKGGHIVHQHFEKNLCLLLFFITDEVKKELLLSEASQLKPVNLKNNTSVVYRIKNNAMLQGFFLSVLSILQMEKPPADEIKKLKIREFAYILSTEHDNSLVLQNLFSMEEYSIARLKTIMNQNFIYNLSLNDFARLCNRSVSSFRRDFSKCYKTTLSKWLISMRLNRASTLLVSTNLSISQVALESGFENLSHFSHNFKQQFQNTPSEYRQIGILNTTAQLLDILAK